MDRWIDPVDQSQSSIYEYLRVSMSIKGGIVRAFIERSVKLEPFFHLLKMLQAPTSTTHRSVDFDHAYFVQPGNEVPERSRGYFLVPREGISHVNPSHQAGFCF
ncbi:hypothetical protein ACMFMG_008832 [Clarireedia jacksonii]